MLQLFVLLILFSINEVKWVAAASDADPKNPQPTPMFTGYDDFEERYKEYNASFYYISSGDDKTACACQGTYVICYTRGDKKVHFVLKTEEPETVRIHNDFDCITCLTQPKLLFKERKCNPDLQFPVSKHLNTVVSTYKSTDRRFITSDLTIVQNFSNVTQTSMTTSYAKDVVESISVAFTFGLLLRAEATLKVPFVSEVKLGFEISASMTKTQTHSTKTTVTAPPQSVTLPSNRTIAVHYSVYASRLVSDSLLNFELEFRKDLGNKRTDPDRFDDVERGVRFRNYRYNFFIGPTRGALVFTKDRKFELLNFPVKQIKDGHDLEIDYSKFHPVYGSEEDPGPYSDELMERPRKLLKKKSAGSRSRNKRN